MVSVFCQLLVLDELLGERLASRLLIDRLVVVVFVLGHFLEGRPLVAQMMLLLLPTVVHLIVLIDRMDNLQLGCSSDGILPGSFAATHQSHALALHLRHEVCGRLPGNGRRRHVYKYPRLALLHTASLA